MKILTLIPKNKKPRILQIFKEDDITYKFQEDVIISKGDVLIIEDE